MTTQRPAKSTSDSANTGETQPGPAGESVPPAAPVDPALAQLPESDPPSPSVPSVDALTQRLDQLEAKIKAESVARVSEMAAQEHRLVPAVGGFLQSLLQRPFDRERFIACSKKLITPFGIMTSGDSAARHLPQTMPPELTAK